MDVRGLADNSQDMRRFISKQAVVALGVSAAVTLFLAWEAAPQHHQTHTVGQRIVVWLAFWLAFAALVRVLVFLGQRARRRKAR
jgi:hypothetical protein